VGNGFVEFMELIGFIERLQETVRSPWSVVRDPQTPKRKRFVVHSSRARGQTLIPRILQTDEDPKNQRQTPIATKDSGVRALVLVCCQQGRGVSNGSQK